MRKGLNNILEHLQGLKIKKNCKSPFGGDRNDQMGAKSKTPKNPIPNI